MVEDAAAQTPLPWNNYLIIGGIVLIFIGFLMLFLGFIYGVLGATRGSAKTEGGAVIIIGPFPILVASSERAAKTLMLLAVLFFIFFVVFYLLSIWVSRRAFG